MLDDGGAIACLFCGRGANEGQATIEVEPFTGQPACPACSNGFGGLVDDYRHRRGVVLTDLCVNSWAIELETWFTSLIHRHDEPSVFYQKMARRVGRQFENGAFRSVCPCLTCEGLRKGGFRHVGAFVPDPDVIRILEDAEDIRASTGPDFRMLADEEEKAAIRAANKAACKPPPMKPRGLAFVADKRTVRPDGRFRNTQVSPTYWRDEDRHVHAFRERVWHDGRNNRYVHDLAIGFFGPETVDFKTGEVVRESYADSWMKAGQGVTLWQALGCSEQDVVAVYVDSFGIWPDFPLQAADFIGWQAEQHRRRAAVRKEKTASDLLGGVDLG